MTMMGLSSAVYLGNEVTLKNSWEEIKKKMEAIETYATQNGKQIKEAKQIRALRISEVDELIRLLNEVYT